MRNLTFMYAFVCTLTSGHLLAADSSAGGQNAVSPTAQTEDSVGGLRMADKSAVAVRYTAITPADIVVSKLLGLKVYNTQNESVGEIEDLVIDNGRTLSGIVVGFGGFLGMGKNYVLIDPASIVISTRENEMRANVDTSKGNLKEAPKFSYEKTSRP